MLPSQHPPSPLPLARSQTLQEVNSGWDTPIAFQNRSQHGKLCGSQGFGPLTWHGAGMAWWHEAGHGQQHGSFNMYTHVHVVVKVVQNLVLSPSLSLLSLSLSLASTHLTSIPSHSISQASRGLT